MSYESNFLSAARGVQESFAGIARSMMRGATALERIATVMEQRHRAASTMEDPPPDDIRSGRA